MHPLPAVWRRASVGGAVLWALALFIAPFAASRPVPSGAWYAVAFCLYAAGSFVCHQLPARSFHLWSSQMPVCARCTGIYLAGTLTALVVVARPPVPGSGERRPGRLALLVAALPTAATLAYEWTTGQTPSNWIRAAAGAPIGAAVAFTLVHAFSRRELPSQRSAPVGNPAASLNDPSPLNPVTPAR